MLLVDELDIKCELCVGLKKAFAPGARQSTFPLALRPVDDDSGAAVGTAHGSIPLLSGAEIFDDGIAAPAPAPLNMNDGAPV